MGGYARGTYPPISKQSEEELRAELRVEGFARSDTGLTFVVADGAGDSAEVASNRIVEGRIVVVVEEVEHLRTELKSDLFSDVAGLEDAQINVAVARSSNLITP